MRNFFWIILIYCTVFFEVVFCCIIILCWSLFLYCGLLNFPLFVSFTKSGIIFDWIIILIWICVALSQISLTFIWYPKQWYQTQIHSVLRRSKKFIFSNFFLFGIFLIMWPEQKRFWIFFCHLKEFSNKKTNPHFGNSDK